ncbi:MAG: AAA family ATPase [Clostridiales bacterium]|jgi:transitional endoplasmic reticulum ATPase|nr:AAA family ATPase [Eubacteriales bacterium]MDH7565625.1 AAA family ATPase [Clostridiales bacterium]
MIGGLSSIKARLRECIESPLKYSGIFSAMKIKNLRGILLYGPPGTGKTLVARAIATESGANFISIKGPELLSKWQGETEKGIREIFRKAKQIAPCIVFFDEIDSLMSVNGHSDSRQISVAAQFLTELDGIEGLENVIAVGATNRMEEF